MNKWILPALLCLCLTACTARPDSSAPKARPEAPPEPAEIEYLDPIRKEPADADTTEAAVPSTDADWTELAAMALSQVGTDVFGQTPASVTRETDDLWQRPEVTVAFADGMNVTFREDTAALIHISAFPSSQDSGTPMAEEDVFGAALSYYNALPYIRGYEYHHVEKYDDRSWSFSFARPIQLTIGDQAYTIYNSLEEVRIVVDPCTGDFQLSNCFDRPLAQEQGEPLTQQQALDALSAAGVVENLDSYEITSVPGVCCPLDAEGRYDEQCHLAWVFTLTGQPDPETGMQAYQMLSLDLYTGEILEQDAA